MSLPSGIYLDRVGTFRLVSRWRWDVKGTPAFGFEPTRRAAARSAVAAMFRWTGI